MSRKKQPAPKKGPKPVQKKAIVKAEPASLPKARQKNYSEEEDVWLVRAFAKNTSNPVEGVGKKGKDFWSNIAQDFNEMAEKDSNKEVIEIRSSDSLMQRYKKTLQPECTKFLAIKRANKENSGENEQAHTDRLLGLFQQKHGKAFKHRACIPAIESIAKYAPLKEPTEVAGMEEEAETGVSTMVPNMPRPDGRNKVKKKIKDDNEKGKKESSADKRNKEIIASIDRIKDTLQLKVNMSKRKAEIDHLLDQRAFYVAVGDNEKAMAVNQELNELKIHHKKLEEEEQMKMAAVNVNDEEVEEDEEDEEVEDDEEDEEVEEDEDEVDKEVQVQEAQEQVEEAAQVEEGVQEVEL